MILIRGGIKMNGIIMLPNELGAALLILLGAIVLDAIFAILIHVKLGDFEWRKNHTIF